MRTTLQIVMDFHTLQLFKEIVENLRNPLEKRYTDSKGFEKMINNYLYMQQTILRLTQKTQDPESYISVRTDQLKKEVPPAPPPEKMVAPSNDTPLHLQGNPNFFKKYPTLQDYWAEQDRKKKEDGS